MFFEKVSVENITENFIKNIGSEYMLISAGNKEKYNMMTASWGFVGEMWGNPTAIAAIRPQRYTNEFVEREEYYTLSFYGENKKIHGICGTKSGRDINKAKQANLTPVFDEETGAPYFKEARLVLVCQKVYAQKLNNDCFIEREIVSSVYPNEDFHIMYYGKILKALVKK